MNAVTAALPRIHLIAGDRALHDAWLEVFEPFEDGAVHAGDCFAKGADPMLILTSRTEIAAASAA